MGKRELFLREGSAFLQRRKPGEYEALGLGKIREVNFIGLPMWSGDLTDAQRSFISHKRG